VVTSESGNKVVRQCNSRSARSHPSVIPTSPADCNANFTPSTTTTTTTTTATATANNERLWLLYVVASMRAFPFTTVLLAWAGLAVAGNDDTVTSGRIKVQLFAAPSFLSEVSVDAYNNQCLSLDNNLYATWPPPMSRLHANLYAASTALYSPSW
jgi:hypothetical protein